MDIAVEKLAGGITKVVLRGRFDTTGAVMVELPFNKVITEKSRIMVDLSAVNFLASYAIRFLLVGATVLTLGFGIILTAPAGIVLLLAIAAIAVMWLVCSVIATFKAYNGESYRYPLTIRLLK